MNEQELADARKEAESWSIEKLRRKEDQHWEMAGLARQDRDEKDSKRHTALARLYREMWQQ